MRDLNLVLVQQPLEWHAPSANRQRFEAIVRELEEPADLVILPEMFTTGFTMEPEGHAEPASGDTARWMASLASETGCTLCGSLAVQVDGRYFNRLLWVPPDGPAGFYDKRHLFRMAGEHEHYSAGGARKIFELNGWRVCPLVCYDLRFPVWSRGMNEFDLLVYVANWPAARRSAWRTLLPARAVENQCYSVGVNRVGIDGKGVRHVGDSGAWDYLGNPLGDCGGEACVMPVRLDLAELHRYREKFPAYLDADPFELLPPVE